MPFLVLGFIIFIVGVIFLRKTIREQDKEGLVGVIAMRQVYARRIHSGAEQSFQYPRLVGRWTERAYDLCAMPWRSGHRILTNHRISKARGESVLLYSAM